MSQAETPEADYAIREFQADNVEGFLDLHSRIFEPDYGRQWFAWKYEHNPYVDHVPIFVAENDGTLVGARPFFALDMTVGGERHLALQPGDTMVHPDHRRRGLFTRMTEAAIEKYGDAEPSFFFNFPNQQSGPGYLKLGWKKVAEQPTYYRVQDPGAFVDGESTTWTSIASLVSKPLVDGYNRLSRARSTPVDGLTVRKYESIPSTVMADLAKDRPRGTIHVARDEQFYDWRFDNPAWDYVAYVAEDAAEPVAGIVVGTSVTSGQTTTKVTDVVPLPDGTASDGLKALFHRLLLEYADTDVLVAPNVIPRSLVRRAGFHRDDRPPFSYVADQTTHVVRSLTGEWEVNGVDLTTEANWRLTFSERDTS